MAEFRAEGRGGPDDASMIGHEHQRFGPTWNDPDGFADYVRTLRADSLEDTPRPVGYVPSTTWWWVDETGYLGRIAVRHRLTPFLLEVGGTSGTTSGRARGGAAMPPRCCVPCSRTRERSASIALW